MMIDVSIWKKRFMRIAKKTSRKSNCEGGLALSDSKTLSKSSVIEGGRGQPRKR